MDQSDLSFFTSQELIAELLRRKTFLGVIVHSETEHRSDTWPAEAMFRVRYNGNLSASRASRLLDRVAEYIDMHDEQ